MDSYRAIRNIVFDMGEVLLPLDSARAAAAFEALGAYTTAGYIHACRTEDMFLAIEMGTLTTAQFCAAVRQQDGIAATDDEICAAWNCLLLPMDSVRREVLLRLRSCDRYRLFVLSNTCALHWEYASSSLLPAPGAPIDSLFSRCFLSYELHCRKPSPEIYRAMAQLAPLVPAETLFIDDSADNVLAAQALGFHTFHETPQHRWYSVLPSLLL